MKRSLQLFMSTCNLPSKLVSVAMLMITVFLIAAGACGDDALYKSELVEASISHSSKTILPGDSVILTLKITNKSRHSIFMYRTPPEKFYVSSCLRNGLPAPLTQYGISYYRLDRSRSRGDAQAVSILPAESREFEIEASRLFDMTKPGKYVFSQQVTLRHLTSEGLVPVGPKKLTVEFTLTESQ